MLLGVVVFQAYRIVENPTNQLFGKTLVSGPKDERVVALTFDDGPNPPYTGEILAVLRAEHVRATFFVVGRAVAAFPGVVRSEAADGDAIGNHTWAHEHLLLDDGSSLRRTLRAHRPRDLRRHRVSHADHAPAVRRARLAGAR